MTVIVKLTSGENKADENVSKGFELIPIAAGMRAAFVRDDQGKGWLNVHGNDDHGEERLLMVIPVLGNAYIMDSGKTVASFSSADIPDLNRINAMDYYRGQSDVKIQPENFSVNTAGGIHVTGDVTMEGKVTPLPETEQCPDDIIDPNDARLVNGDRTRVGNTYEAICVIMEGVGSFPTASHEHVFATGLAAAIESYRSTKSKHKPVIKLGFTGSVVCSRDVVEKLENHFRLVDTPVSLRIDTNENDYITEYRVEGYYNRHDVDEADMLLLRDLRNKQVGLLKNVIDKLIKYYKAGVSVVPLEPATTITDTQRERIRHKLYDVLKTHFSFIVAEGEGAAKSTGFPDEDSASYTHVVIRFPR